MFTGKMPNITAAQIVAVVGNAVAVAIAFGAPISTQQQQALLALAAVLGSILVASDAHLRGRRAQAEAIKHVANLTVGGAAAAAQSNGGTTEAVAVPTTPAAAVEAVARALESVSPKAAAALRGQ